jgi:hypothetical protein
MGARGRTSADELLVASSVVPFRPLPVQPPDALTDAEASIFKDVVAAMPDGWFKADTVALLVEYSRAVDACNKLAAMREQEGLALRDLTLVLTAHEKQARLVAMFATKMRLSQQSRILPQTAGTAVANKPVAAPPWGGARAGTAPGSSSTAKSRTAS